MTFTEMERRRWGPGGRQHFGDPRPGDYPGKADPSAVRKAPGQPYVNRSSSLRLTSPGPPIDIGLTSGDPWRHARDLLAAQWGRSVIASAAQSLYAALVWHARTSGRTVLSQFQVSQAITAYIAARPLPFSPADSERIRLKLSTHLHLHSMLDDLEETGLIARSKNGRTIWIITSRTAPKTRAAEPGEYRRMEVADQLDLAERVISQMLAAGPCLGDLAVAERMNRQKPDDVLPFSLYQARRLRLKLIEQGRLHVVEYAERSKDEQTGQWTSAPVQLSAAPPEQPPAERVTRKRRFTGIARIKGYWWLRHRPAPGENVEMLRPFDIELIPPELREAA